MSEEMTQEAGAQAGRSMPCPNNIAGAEQFPSQSVRQDKGDDDGASPASSRMDSREPEEVCIPSFTPPDAEGENVGTSTAVDDPIEVELVAKLEALLVKDVKLSARYGVLLLNHRKTARERRTIRAEMRRLHTEEGAILLEVKLHRARKGRGGGWAEFLRQRKPKRLSRTTADRWIKWYLDAGRQKQSQSETTPGQLTENAPQNESGAFSCGNAQSPALSSHPQPPVPAGPPPVNCSEAFEDLQQVKVLLKKSKAAHFKAAAEYAATKLGFVTSHEAIYVTFTEAIATRGFVYSTLAKEGDTTNVSKGVNPGTEAPARGSKAA